MARLFQIDLQQVFWPQISIIELVLRGSLVYLMLLGILRLLPSRQVGGLGISDLLVIVLVATAVQDATATKDSSIIGGLILATTIVSWSYLFTWLSHKFPAWQRFLSPPPLLLVKDGEVLQQNMERGLISKRELMSQLRQQGVHSLNKVKKAYIEGDGRISIFTKDSKSGETPKRQFPASVVLEGGVANRLIWLTQTLLYKGYSLNINSSATPPIDRADPDAPVEDQDAETKNRENGKEPERQTVQENEQQNTTKTVETAKEQVQTSTSPKCTFSRTVVAIDLKRFTDSGVTLVECLDCGRTRSLSPVKGVLRFPLHEPRKMQTEVKGKRWSTTGKTDWDVVVG